MDIILTAILNTTETKGAEYFARPAGSSLVGVDSSNGLDVAKLLEQLDWMEVTDEAVNGGMRFGACRYFRAPLPEGVSGLENVALLDELADHELDNVKVVRGHHGNLELQLPNMEPRATDVVHLIIGNGQNFPDGEVTLDTALVVTWYPGRLTPPVGVEKATVKGVK